MVDFGAHAEGLGEGVGTEGHDHELLEVGGVGGVLAAVEDVEHGHREEGVGARVQGTCIGEGPGGRPTAWAAARETPKMALAPSRDLSGVPSKSMRAASRADWSRMDIPLKSLGNLTLDVA